MEKFELLFVCSEKRLSNLTELEINGPQIVPGKCFF